MLHNTVVNGTVANGADYSAVQQVLGSFFLIFFSMLNTPVSGLGLCVGRTGIQGLYGAYTAIIRYHPLGTFVFGPGGGGNPELIREGETRSC